MNRQQHFPVEGMTCENCVRHVEQALKNLAGIEQLEVHLEQKEVVVKYDPTQVSYDTMASTLKEAGYTLGTPVD